MKSLQHLQNISRRSLQRAIIKPSFLNATYMNRFSFSTQDEVSYTLEQLKELRAISGAPIKECKKALVNTKDAQNRITEAIDWLRVRGITISQQKSGDIANHGFIALFRDKTDASLVEVNCVTDFVEHNPLFQDAVLNIGNTILRNETDIFPNYGLSVDELSSLPIIDYNTNQQIKQTINESLTDIISSIRENLVFRRAYKMHCSPSGVICGYLHGRKNDNLGMKGSLVSLETDLESIDDEIRDQLNELGQNIATHIVANYPQPKYVNRDELTVEQVEKERELILKTIMEKDPESKLEIVEKQIDGRMKKYFIDNVLMEQPFCLEDDNKLTIEKLVKSKQFQLKCDIQIAHMVVYNLGEA